MKGTIVLFPGGFKPIHTGHLSLIRRYSKLSGVSKIRLLVGPKERDGITQEKAIEIANLFFTGDAKVSVEASKWPSPVLTAFKEVENAREESSYTLASSTKGKDYERARDFIDKHQQGEKYHERLKPGIDVVSLPVNVDPVNYRSRKDGFDGPISASILRKDIENSDYDNFRTNYPGENPVAVEFVWLKLIKLL